MENNFEQYNNRKISDKVCEIHKVNYWKISTPIRGSKERSIQEFCPECTKELIERQDREGVDNSLNAEIYLKTYNVLMRDSTIPRELKEASFENFIAETAEEKQLLAFAREQVDKYLDGVTGNTLFTGSTGIGKSHLSVAIAKAINEGYKAKGEPKSVLFVNLTEILRRVRESFNSPTSLEGYYSRMLKEVDYLVLDDLGIKSDNASSKGKSFWEEEFIFDILSNRDKTIITTNLSNSEITSMYSDRVASRVRTGLEGNFFKSFTIKDKRYSIKRLKEKQHDITTF
ncbi:MULTISPECIES: DnaA/Hda family protein [Streptococcus]|uniref:Zinc finger protein n=1 Tax=Streptococcus pseudopneumoniae TaxID=257758 RepID=A0A0U0CM60_9STRE|nr:MULTISPECIES: DnaA/Hda family protein [Streptococcus]QBX10407.1 helicase loader [Streptococcus satellite phage Javan435]MBW8142980.1 ATP-binding protein [Streptococcus pseudopneumoniae]MDS9311627.1 DnaA/Hda family protein [Streptococcus pseudopneumoniae]NIB82139.1 ATP-binding protein [Streptococcus pseudopneumoniae]NIB89875.1 ATP-binding protein [Streptococcus pseudopneumoniae]